MAVVTPQRFSLDSTLELVADQWSADFASPTLFSTADPADRLSLSAGLLDANNNPVMFQAVTEGVIDEYELTVTPTNVRLRMHGRDAAAGILDKYFAKSYIRSGEAALLASGDLFREQLPGFSLGTWTAGAPRASQIAAEALASVGLGLIWEARDYTLATSFRAEGRIVDILRRLVEPWTLVEPFKADIYIDGKTVVVRPRSTPGRGLEAPPENVFSIRAARRGQLVVRKRRLRKVGRVLLRGRRRIGGGDPNATTTIGAYRGSRTDEVVSETYEDLLIDVPGGSGKMRNPKAGKLKTRTVTRTTYRTPDEVDLTTEKTVFTLGQNGRLTMSTRETITNEWESVPYDGQTGQLLGQPKKLQQNVITESVSTSDRIFRVTATDETQYTWSLLGFQTGESTTRREYSTRTRRLENVKLTLKTMRDVGALMSEETQEVFAWDSRNNQWLLQQRTASLGGGYRPGGPGRGGILVGVPETAVATAAAAASDYVTIDDVISEDEDAIAVAFSNDHLTLDDLQVIFDQLREASDVWEYEVAFSGVAMPWLKRGSVVQFFGVDDGDGNPIILPPMVVTETRGDYDESTEGQGRYFMDGRAFAWSDS